MVDFKKVTKDFGSVRALSDVSFSIKGGEFVFIVGESGAGKTTVLKLLLGEIRPSSGEIVLDGEEIGSAKRSELWKARRKIGVVFQDFRLLEERTLAENIEVVLAINKISKDEWESRVDQVLKVVGLADKRDFFPAQLSGGEIQRAAIARALASNPKIVFADEPTGNLDWQTAWEIMELLVKINEEGKTVIVASHHKDIIKKLKKRLIRLSKGKIVKSSD